MEIQSTIFICICLVGYFDNISGLSVPFSNVDSDPDLYTEKPMGNSNLNKDVEQPLKTRYLRPDFDRPMKSSDPDFDVVHPAQKSNLGQNVEQANENSYLGPNVERLQLPMEESYLGHATHGAVNPGIAYGYATDGSGYKCAYFVPSHRDSHGPRYIIIRCSKGEGSAAKFYGCDYRGFPTSCEWYNKPGNARIYYTRLAKNIASGNDGKCNVSWIHLGYCSDISFRLVKK